MATKELNYLSDTSDLTDLPDLVCDSDDPFGEEFDLSDYSDSCPATPSGGCLVPVTMHTKTLGSLNSPSCSTNMSTMVRRRGHTHLIKHSKVLRNKALSPIELMPNEIIQKIAGHVASDTDLCNLILSSSIFPDSISADASEIWRTRFLARYDHPMTDGPFDFSSAYKLRRLVLKNFIDFTGGISRRTEIQLEVLRDMVLETYNKSRSWMPPPTVSRNLKVFQSPDTSPWVVILLSSAYPGITDKKRWGETDSFFETVQIVLSHLLLSPTSAVSHQAASSRMNYDLVRVYNFNEPFATLYHDDSTKMLVRNTLFPNLRSSDLSPDVRHHTLDTTSLLHIRNFWHRHLIDDSHPEGEHTYADMARSLAKLGKTPQKWDKALNADIKISTRWFGNYSCLHPWPKARKDLEERQSCAEDWSHVDPMMIDLLSSSDYREGFWPPAFSTIPAFDSTIVLPSIADDADPWLSDIHWRKQKQGTLFTREAQSFPRAGEPSVYICGIAPFINLNPQKSSKDPQQELSSNVTVTSTQQEIQAKYLKHHPFTALRVRGVIHDIPVAATLDSNSNADEKAIPGWKRIAMVMYKPNITYMINVLEHAEEDYGGVFGTQFTNQLNTTNVWGVVGANAANVITTDGSNTAVSNSSVSTVTTQPGSVSRTQTSTNTITTATANAVIPPTMSISPADLATQLTNRLYTLLTSPTCPIPTSSMTISSPSLADQITRLENAYIPPQHLTWDESTIDFAYAYEGVVLPGGKIMMGRWWRCHAHSGLGQGWEVDAQGEGVGDETDINRDGEDGDVEMEDADNVDENVAGVGNVSGKRDLERGPFIFWC